MISNFTAGTIHRTFRRDYYRVVAVLPPSSPTKPATRVEIEYENPARPGEDRPKERSIASLSDSEAASGWFDPDRLIQLGPEATFDEFRAANEAEQARLHAASEASRTSRVAAVQAAQLADTQAAHRERLLKRNLPYQLPVPFTGTREAHCWSCQKKPRQQRGSGVRALRLDDLPLRSL